MIKISDVYMHLNNFIPDQYKNRSYLLIENKLRGLYILNKYNQITSDIYTNNGFSFFDEMFPMEGYISEKYFEKILERCAVNFQLIERYKKDVFIDDEKLVSIKDALGDKPIQEYIQLIKKVKNIYAYMDVNNPSMKIIQKEYDLYLGRPLYDKHFLYKYSLQKKLNSSENMTYEQLPEDIQGAFLQEYSEKKIQLDEKFRSEFLSIDFDAVNDDVGHKEYQYGIADLILKDYGYVSYENIERTNNLVYKIADNNYGSMSMGSKLSYEFMSDALKINRVHVNSENLINEHSLNIPILVGSYYDQNNILFLATNKEPVLVRYDDILLSKQELKSLGKISMSRDEQRCAVIERLIAEYPTDFIHDGYSKILQNKFFEEIFNRYEYFKLSVEEKDLFRVAVDRFFTDNPELKKVIKFRRGRVAKEK